MNNDTPSDIKISMIVPVYNVEENLGACIESICNQDYASLEIILVDDGSTDSSGSICDEYAKKDNRIIVIHEKNSGVSAARNTGLRASSGEYILFSDSDDYIYDPMMIKKLSEIVKDKKYDLVSFGYHRRNLDGSEDIASFPTGTKSFNDSHEVTQFITHDFIDYKMAWELWAKMYRHDIIFDHNVFFEDTSKVLGEDVCFDLNYLYYCHSVYQSDITPYCYIRRMGSLTLNGTKSSALCIINMMNSIFSNLEENGIPVSLDDIALTLTAWLNREIGLMKLNNPDFADSSVVMSGIAAKADSHITVSACVHNWGLKYGLAKYMRVRKYLNRSNLK
jgi:glycosyltransferase involved in cell wall biosynthesis